MHVPFLHQWRELLKDRAFRLSLFTGLALLLTAHVVNYQAILYTNQIPVLSVGDIILDNVDTYDLSALYIWGIYFTAFIVFIYPVFFRPELTPFTAKTVASFILIRAFFISLTHLGAPAEYFRLPQFEDQPGLFQFFYMNDLFFSGHTGMPFLAALLFWENRLLRFLLIGWSFVQAGTVLLMHVHYSIDVFSAYFITYSIYKVSNKIFRELNLSFKRIILKIRPFKRELGR